jgi:murein DD-endopeptidase MepM/ murein hydrolase activator NlpD
MKANPMKIRTSIATAAAAVLLSMPGTALALTNYALNQYTQASSVYNNDSTWGAYRANDGNLGTKWASASEPNPYIYFYLGGTRTISQVTVRHASAGVPAEGIHLNTYAYLIQYWANNAWITAKTVDNSTRQGVVTSLVNFTAAYARIYITNVNGGNDNIARIYEVEVLGGGGCSPNPANLSLGWPLSGSWASHGSWQPWTSSPYHYGDDQYAQDWRNGTSWLCGGSLYAPLSGTIIYKGALPAGSGYETYGNHLVIRSNVNTNYAVLLAHLQSYAPGISNGVTVSAGQLLGYVGNSGSPPAPNSFGCHAHVALYQNITATSPINSARTGVDNLVMGSSPMGALTTYRPSPYSTSFSLNASGCSNP